MRHLILASLVLLLAFAAADCALGQAALRGRVIDSYTGAPLQGAHVRFGEGREGGVSGAQGDFILPLPVKGGWVLRVTYTGYAPARIVVKRNEPLADPLVVAMDRQAVELGPAVITAERAPEVVFENDTLHVGAFLVNEAGIWVLTYERPVLWHAEADAGKQVMRHARVVLLDTLFAEVARATLPEDAFGIVKDYGGRAVIKGERYAWVAHRTGDSITFGRMDRDRWEQEVRPWTDSLSHLLIGSSHDATYPAFDHVCYDLRSGTSHVLCSVRDERTMSLFRSQYKYMSGRDKVMAMDLEKETGVDREVIAGYMTGFHNDLYFRPPYAPLFVRHDTLLVFDQYAGRMRRFTPDREELTSVRIDFQNQRTWVGRLVQDPVTGTVHALFHRGTRLWLRPVDADSGVLGEASQLTYPYPEEVQVADGWAYYVYRPYGSLRHRTLYRERLK